MACKEGYAMSVEEGCEGEREREGGREGGEDERERASVGERAREEGK